MAKSKKRKKKVQRPVQTQRVEAVRTEESGKKTWARVLLLLIACVMIIGVIVMPVMAVTGKL